MGTTKYSDLVMGTPPKMKVEVWSDIMCPFCLYRQTKLGGSA